MQVLTIECAAEDKDLLIARLYELDTRGIVEEDLPGERVELRAFFDQAFEAGEFASHGAEWTPADETNWARKIMEDWDPVLVGERWFLVPDWRSDPTPPGRLRLEVRPGVALGTGYHPTTQMCLEAMERYFEAGNRFFDLGCGSGILSHAARLIGAGRLVTADTDPQATESAAENMERFETPVLLFTGSVDAVADAAVDFLVANISAEALIELRDEIRRCVAPGGIAVLSGFPPARTADLCEAFASGGFDTLGTDARGEWACVVARSPR